jgi:hypothetical protein
MTNEYKRKVRALMEEGMTRSDAQGCVDAQLLAEQAFNNNNGSDNNDN